MLKKSRFYIPAMLAAVVLASLLITTNVKACEEAPQTFLTAYMNSDIVVLAKYDSDGAARRTSEDEYGYALETPRNLVVSKVYKGAEDLQNISFTYYDYVPTQTGGETDSPEAVENDDHAGEDFFNVTKIKIGGEYLFFLKLNKETGEYGVTDYVSGVKEAGKNLSVYEKNMSELNEIVAAGNKAKYAKLTEWMVKNIEDPVMREDAISDLAESFNGLKYPDETTSKSSSPFVVNDGWGIYTVGVAAKLTPAQMNRLSAALYPMLQEAWFAEKPQYANYGVATILSGINKTKLAVHAYNSLQSVAKDDLDRKFIIMDALTLTVEDETLSNIYYEYMETENKIKEIKGDSPEAKKQLKTLQETRTVQLRNFDNRFKLLYSKNFAKVEEKNAQASVK